MPPHFRFAHLCGHIGISPMMPPNNRPCPQAQEQTDTTPPTTTTQISIPSACPFCTNGLSAASPTQPQPADQPLGTSTLPDLSTVPPGTGIIVLLACPALYIPYHPPLHSRIWGWRPLRISSTPIFIPTDLEHISQQPHSPGFRYLAWIPKPVGNVQLGCEDGQDFDGQRASTTKVTAAWRLRGGGRGESRFPGLVSQLQAAVLSTERAGSERNS